MQVKRWETNRYEGVGVDRLQEIANDLDAQILETICCAVPAEVPLKA